MQHRKFKMSALGVILLPLFTSGQVFVSDVIVQASICVGGDCVSNESFGFDTNKYKENNLRIYFDDTSNSASFPSNDWRIAINDTNNGGGSNFAVQDATAATTPFRVMAGAGNNAMYVSASGGNVGLGTSSPVVELQVTDGNSPTLRLEQDVSNGFAAQTWDVAGNETNFFIRDVTGGSKLPFKIIPGAPDNAIYVNASGNVTLGSTQDEEKLFVKGNISAEGDIHLRKNGADYYKFALIDDGRTFSIQDALTDNDVVVIKEDAPTNSLYIHEDGDISIGSNLQNRRLYINGGLTVNGDIYALSDRRIKQNISELEYGLPDVLKLSAKQFNFNTEGYEELNLSKDLQLGLIAQDVQNVIPEIVTNDINVKDSEGKMSTLKGVNYTALIPVLINAIQEQHKLLIEKDEELEMINSQLAELTARVDALVGEGAQKDELPIKGSVNFKDSDDPNSNVVPVQAAKTEQALDNGRSEADILKRKKEGSQ